MSAGGGVELAGEQEVDFRRLFRLLAARWWLLGAGLLAGLALAYLVVWGGGSIWRARAVVSLGQPYAPGGVLSSYGGNPSAIEAVVRSQKLLREAAAATGLPLAALRGHVSTGRIGAAAAPAGTAHGQPLLTLTVEGSRPAKVAAAANWLAAAVVAHTTGAYIGAKIRLMRANLASRQQRITNMTRTVATLQQQAANRRLAPLDRLVLTTRLNAAIQLLGTLSDQRSALRDQLAFTQTVESARVVNPAVAAKSARHPRQTTLLLGALLGLLLATIVALAWQPGRARPPR